MLQHDPRSAVVVPNHGDGDPVISHERFALLRVDEEREPAVRESLSPLSKFSVAFEAGGDPCFDGCLVWGWCGAHGDENLGYT